MHSIAILFVLTLAVGYTFTRDIALDQQWNLWKQTNNKYYSDAEEGVRYEVLFIMTISHFSLKYEIVVVVFGKIICK